MDTGLDAFRTPSKRVLHKAAEATGEFIADKIVKTEPIIEGNSRNVEKITILPKKREEILNELRKV